MSEFDIFTGPTLQRFWHAELNAIHASGNCARCARVLWQAYRAARINYCALVSFIFQRPQYDFDAQPKGTLP